MGINQVGGDDLLSMRTVSLYTVTGRRTRLFVRNVGMRMMTCCGAKSRMMMIWEEMEEVDLAGLGALLVLEMVRVV